MTGLPDKPVPPRNSVARLRRMGLAILLVGLLCSAAVYWVGLKSEAPADDLSGQITMDDSKVIARNNELLYGKTASALMGLFEDLKRPSGLALLILTTSVVGSFACFHLARLTEERG